MSRFTGRMYKGAAREAREQRRLDAIERQKEYDAKKPVVITEEVVIEHPEIGTIKSRRKRKRERNH